MSTSPLGSSTLAATNAASSSGSSSYNTGPQMMVGVSKYSEDLQSILSRAVSIAEVPVQRLQNAQADAVSKKALLVGLNMNIDSLAQSIGKLGTLASGGALAAASSDAGVSVVNSGAAAPGTWRITGLTSVPTAASARSAISYANPAKTAVSTTGGHMTLVVGQQSYNFTASNLTQVVAAINGSGLPVAASILSPSSGANYLSLTATSTGATALHLLDGVPPPSGPPDTRTDLLTSIGGGSNVNFSVNGLLVANQGNNVISNVIPGVTFTLNSAPASGNVTISLATDPTELSSALNNFVNSYNALVDNVDQQVGQSAGALAGDTAITAVQDDMRRLVSYQGSGTIRSLSDLGISMDTQGKMTFDQNTFAALSPAQISGACAFLGSSASGLAALANNFTQLSDPVSGMIRTEENGLDQTNKNLTNQIAAMNSRILVMQQALQAKLQQADAMLAALESQQSMLTASLTSLSYVLYGKQVNQLG